MIIFFDRNTGTAIPKALKEHLKPVGAQVEYHQLYFDHAEKDDVWLAQVGNWGWFVIAQDYSFHERALEKAAIQAHQIGVFYLWGAEATKWDAFRAFARGYDRIIQAATNTERPFIYRVEKSGALNQVYF